MIQDLVLESMKMFIVLLPVAILIRTIYYFTCIRKRYFTNKYHEIGTVVLIAYLLVVLALTQNIRYIFENGLVPNPSINLVPFKQINGYIELWKSGTKSVAVMNLVGNVAIFIPIGFLLPLVWRRAASLPMTFLFTTLLTVCIEVGQIFSGGRATDIDDVILNVSGGLLGYGLYWIIKRISPSLTSKFQIEVNYFSGMK